MEIENSKPGSSLDNNIQFKTILVIEDILYVLKSIEKILKEEGYYVLTAMTGKEALEIFKNYSPDLVTIDQKLPDTSGTKLLEEINKLNLDKKPKIIFISAIYDKDEIQKLLLHNVSNYLIKPFKKNKLVEVVKELIGNP
jgi:two-component system, chemotaxis family, chemotaxis protein CheY